jgi:hypothetical protein
MLYYEGYKGYNPALISESFAQKEKKTNIYIICLFVQRPLEIVLKSGAGLYPLYPAYYVLYGMAGLLHQYY